MTTTKQVGETTYFDKDEGEAYVYTLVTCVRCSSPLLAVRDVYDDFSEGISYGEPRRVYPLSGDELRYTVPVRIRLAFDEAVMCLRARAYTASAILCRKALEGMCVELGEGSGTLAARLDTLLRKGLIDQSYFDWAKEFKDLGNDAAHDVNVTVAKKDAEDLIQLTHALLENTFTFRPKFEELKKRRANAF
ncbi:MAG TPA: DUF4145 domain-containing protein [Pantanalinema sp.]